MNRVMLNFFLPLALFVFSGCASNYVYVSQKKGRLEPMEGGKRKEIKLIPRQQEQEIEGVKIKVWYISDEELDQEFKDRRVYGKFAIGNPYPEDVIVFKVRIENNSTSRIYINPKYFVLLDDLGNQYLYLNPDDLKEFYKSRSFIYSFVKSTFSMAPGIYGKPANLATSLAGRGLERKYALLKFIELTGGHVYPGVVYDGYIAFLKPSLQAKRLRLLFSNIKTRFDVNDEALGSIDFVFEFECE